MHLVLRSATGGALIIVLVLGGSSPVLAAERSPRPRHTELGIEAVPGPTALAEQREGGVQGEQPPADTGEAAPAPDAAGDTDHELPEPPTEPQGPAEQSATAEPPEPTGEEPDVPDSETPAPNQDGAAEDLTGPSPQRTPAPAGAADSTAHAAPDAAVDPAQVPERVAVSGTVIVIAEEPAMPSTLAHDAPVAGDEEPIAAVDPDLSAPQLLLATDEGAVLPLDPETVGIAETGQRFEGEISLDLETRVDIAETLTEQAQADTAGESQTAEPAEEPESDAGTAEPAAGAVTEVSSESDGDTPDDPPAAAPAQALRNAAPGGSGPPPLIAEEVVLGAAIEESRTGGAPLAVAGLIIPGTGPGAHTQPKAHAADVLFYSGGGAPSDGQLTQLVRDAGTYWVGQTRGIMSSLSVGGVKRSSKYAANRGMRCDSRNLDALWDHAARQFGRTASNYIGSGRHLVVFVDDNCGALAQNSAGWGSYGVMHSGGLVWIDLGARKPGGLPITGVTGMVTHELGHNLGLGHGKSRVCTGSATDSPTRGGVPQAPCSDIEYGDPFNVMGIGAWRGDRRPPALTVAQQDALGAAGPGAVRTVRPSGGASQTFTLAPTGNSSGLRGLNVAGSVGGEFYVEFRAMSGQDTGMGLRAGSVYENGKGRGEYFTASGVRMVKRESVHNLNGTHRFGSTVVSVRDSQLGVSGLYQTARKGKQLTPWNSTVRVVVLDAGPKSARVRVDFMPFVDVPYSHKFANEIAWMGTSSLSTGSAVAGGLREYRPSDRVSREAMAAFLYRMEAPKNYRAPAVSPFADVPTNHKFYREISWMHRTGLSTGTRQKIGKPKYLPKSHVSREAMAAFLYRLEKPRVGLPKTSPFRDMKPGQKFYREVVWMSQAGLSTGTAQPSGKPKYLPKSGVSREAMAAFLQRMHR